MAYCIICCQKPGCDVAVLDAVEVPAPVGADAVGDADGAGDRPVGAGAPPADPAGIAAARAAAADGFTPAAPS